ncbi:hypothetical protein Tco_1255092 [Tanacetum coccineum]
MVAFLKKPTENVGFTEIVDFLKGTSLRTLANGIQELVASIDNKEYTITEASVRSKLQLADATGINNLPDAEIYEGLTTLGGYAGEHVPLLPAMLAGAAQDQGESSAIPAATHYTPIDLEPEIPQSHGPTLTPVADEATTTSVEVKAEGATTITTVLDSGLDIGNIHESPLRSHEAPFPEGNTSGSAGDSLKLKELMEIVPKLESKIDSLKKELKETKKTKKVVVSDSEDEETENQGRKIIDIDDDPLVSLVRDYMEEKDTDFVTPTKVSASREAQKEEISPTILEAAKTLSQVASQTVSTYKRRAKLTDKGKDIGTGLDAGVKVSTGRVDINPGSAEVNTSSKEINIGSTQISTPSIVVSIPSPIRQEEAGLAEAVRLQAQLDEEVAKQVHLDEMVARRVQEEQKLTDQQVQRMAQVHKEAQHYTEEDWDNIRAKLEANTELVKDMLGENMSSKDYAKRMVDMINQKRKYFAEQKAKARRNKHMTQAEQRTYMSTYLKKQGTWKLTQLKKLTFTELKEEFEKLTPKKQKINDKDVPVTEEKVEGVKKEEPVKRIGKRKKQIARKGISVDKTAQDETKEREAYMIDKVTDPSSGFDIGIDAIPTATKPPSIVNWKIIPQPGWEGNVGAGIWVLSWGGRGGGPWAVGELAHWHDGLGHIARECPRPKRLQDSDYFKDKMLLMQAQESGAVLDEEQSLFLAGEQVTNVDDDVDDSTENDLALNVDHIFEADECDAFDSDVDEGPTSQTMFMANLTSEDPIYDEAGTSYDSNNPFEVQDHDTFVDHMNEYHEVHEMQNDVQHNYVVDSDADYTSDSNIIPYDQYVEDNEEHVVQCNASSVRNDALMSILDEMHEQGVQSRLANKPDMVMNDSVTSELARYKELVGEYEKRAKFELTDRERKIDEQMRIIISDRNRKETSLKSELHSAQILLSSTVDHYKSKTEEVTLLKKDFKQKEDKFLEEFLDLKKLKDKIEDRLYKQDQSVQTVHMLCKPKSFYDEKHKVAIGYKNPVCLARAKQAQSALYNGHVLVTTNHTPTVIHDSEDTRELAEITRNRMLLKMQSPLCVENKVRIAPPPPRLLERELSCNLCSPKKSDPRTDILVHR